MCAEPKPIASPETSVDYHRIARAIAYLEAHVEDQPSLEEVAGHLGLSVSHAQRLFRRWAGISPKRFLQFLTAAEARARLDSSRSLLEVAWDVGLSGAGRLHDLIVNVHAMTPGELRDGGRGLTIGWGEIDSPFGAALLAFTAQGVCALAFLSSEDGLEAEVERLVARHPRATLERDDARADALAARIFGAEGGRSRRVDLHVAGTNFQLKVWEALLRIPPGAVTTYGALAASLGKPSASRAVGGAVGANPVAWLVPCHRVIRKTGAFGDYRWGATRKKAILLHEAGDRA